MKTEIIPVIHMLATEQIFANVDTCIKCGIEKVFIINHVVEVDKLLNTACKVKNTYPDLWVGVNMLGLTAEQALRRCPIGIDGVCAILLLNSIRDRYARISMECFSGAFRSNTNPHQLI